MPAVRPTEDLQTFLPGCQHIFLDVGSNRRTHVRKLFKPEKYPYAPIWAHMTKASGTLRGAANHLPRQAFALSAWSQIRSSRVLTKPLSQTTHYKAGR